MDRFKAGRDMLRKLGVKFGQVKSDEKPKENLVIEAEILVHEVLESELGLFWCLGGQDFEGDFAGFRKLVGHVDDFEREGLEDFKDVFKFKLKILLKCIKNQFFTWALLVLNKRRLMTTWKV